ncbi:MAG: hypothetical protein AAF677_00965 [Pseudomonadota bacterium]
MELIADGLLIATALTAALYCSVLSRRLRRLANTEEGLGGEIARLNGAIAEIREAVGEMQQKLVTLRGQSQEVSERVRRELARAHRTVEDLGDATTESRRLLDALYDAADRVRRAPPAAAPPAAVPREPAREPSSPLHGAPADWVAPPDAEPLVVGATVAVPGAALAAAAHGVDAGGTDAPDPSPLPSGALAAPFAPLETRAPGPVAPDAPQAPSEAEDDLGDFEIAVPDDDILALLRPEAPGPDAQNGATPAEGAETDRDAAPARAGNAPHRTLNGAGRDSDSNGADPVGAGGRISAAPNGHDTAMDGSDTLVWSDDVGHGRAGVSPKGSPDPYPPGAAPVVPPEKTRRGAAANGAATARDDRPTNAPLPWQVDAPERAASGEAGSVPRPRGSDGPDPVSAAIASLAGGAAAEAASGARAVPPNASTAAADAAGAARRLRPQRMRL